MLCLVIHFLILYNCKLKMNLKPSKIIEKEIEKKSIFSLIIEDIKQIPKVFMQIYVMSKIVTGMLNFFLLFEIIIFYIKSLRKK